MLNLIVGVLCIAIGFSQYNDTNYSLACLSFFLAGFNIAIASARIAIDKWGA